MTKCIDGLFDPDGDWKARATHSPDELVGDVTGEVQAAAHRAGGGQQLVRVEIEQRHGPGT